MLLVTIRSALLRPKNLSLESFKTTSDISDHPSQLPRLRQTPAMSSDRRKRRRIQREVQAMMAEISQADAAFDVIPVIQHEDSFVANSNVSNEVQCSSQTQHFTGALFQEFSSVLNVENSEQNSEVELGSQLAVWAVDNNITQCALDQLLKILKPVIPSANLPICSKTLLHTPRQYKLSDIGEGKFYYFGLIPFLTKVEVRELLPSFDKQIFRMSLGVDGLPISRSSRRQFWPILISFNDCNRKSPHLIGLYFGTTKPASLEQFLQPLVTDILDLNGRGVEVAGYRVKLVISNVIADAPARSFLKCTVPYNAYSGCERCVDRGKFLGRVIFSKTDATKRTNNDFLCQSDPSHHNGVSPLVSLGIGLVTDVVLDYMHLVCLGTVRKLLQTWYKGPLPFRIGHRNIMLISNRLNKLRKYVPCEFNRKPRSVFELDNWKASEFRTFLLYLGPVVLRGVLDAKNTIIF